MAKRKVALKKDPKSMKLSTLPGIAPVESDAQKASRFISKLQSEGFVSKHQWYLENYINSELSIAFNHLKESYKTYVLNGNWDEKKFKSVLESIMQTGEMLVPKAFMKYGLKYDLAQEENIYQEDEVTDDMIDQYMRELLGGSHEE